VCGSTNKDGCFVGNSCHTLVENSGFLIHPSMPLPWRAEIVVRYRTGAALVGVALNDQHFLTPRLHASRRVQKCVQLSLRSRNQGYETAVWTSRKQAETVHASNDTLMKEVCEETFGFLLARQPLRVTSAAPIHPACRGIRRRIPIVSKQFAVHLARTICFELGGTARSELLPAGDMQPLQLDGVNSSRKIDQG